MEDEPKARKKRARVDHRCVDCQAAMPCPAKCAHRFRIVGEPVKKGPSPLGLCRKCIERLSKKWPPGYPVDGETRALVRLALSHGIDVRDLLARSIKERHEDKMRLLRSLTTLPASVVETIAPSARREVRREKALDLYLDERFRGVPSKEAAANACRMDPTLKSHGHVRKEASLLLRRKTAPVTRKVAAEACPDAPRADLAPDSSPVRTAATPHGTESKRRKPDGRKAYVDGGSCRGPSRQGDEHPADAVGRVGAAVHPSGKASLVRTGRRPRVARVAEEDLDVRPRPGRVKKAKRRRPPP